MRQIMHHFRRAHPLFWACLALALAAIMLYRPGPLASVLEHSSRGVALLATLSNETQREAQFEVLLENCQAQLKPLQLAWYRLSYGSRMTAITTPRVFGPFFLLLLLAPLEALRRPEVLQQESRLDDDRC